MRDLMTKIGLAFLAAFTIYGCSNSTQEPSSENPELTWEKVPITSAALRVTGRADWSKKGQVSIFWSGSAFTIGFEGTALKINLDATYALFDVFIDDDLYPSIIIDRSDSAYPSNEITVVKNLSDKPHSVRIQKNTEIAYGKATLKGIQVLGTASASALPPMPKKKIEFIGNSITCGYGIFGNENDMYTIVSEDHFYTYANQAALILKAEEHTVCYSGKGTLRNCDNTTTLLIPEIYNKLSLETGTLWNTEEWVPDLIFANLGANDFNTTYPDSSSFVNAVINFVKQLRGYYPNTSITLLDGPMMTGDEMITCRKFLDAAQQALIASGDKNVYRFSFDPQGELGYGIAEHPNQAQGQKDAVRLAEWVLKTFEWDN